MTIREVTIGRSKNSDIYLDDHCQYASKYHATLYYDGSQLMYRDTSTNGTLINNINVKNRAVPIHHGDTIMVAGQYPVTWNQIDQFFPPRRPEPVFTPPVVVQPITPPMPEVQPEIDEWSWGAFMFYPLWGFFNGCWWAFLVNIAVGWTLIPSIIFGVQGRRLAWENRRWQNAEAFNEAQDTWDGWGMAFFFLSIAIIVFSVMVIFANL
ncbi:MAG: FHA domain-containing protein [Bacteroidaceae bacterium]|nr:FHA domain-containing protein [Bacteroidaceae bacterium]